MTDKPEIIIIPHQLHPQEQVKVRQQAVVEEYLQRINLEAEKIKWLESQFRMPERLGSLKEKMKGCGTKTCCCHTRRELHGPYWYHRHTVDGKAKFDHICLVGKETARLNEIKEGIDNHKFNKSITRQIAAVRRGIRQLEKERDRKLRAIERIQRKIQQELDRLTLII